MRYEQLVGVYDADGTVRGELAYLIGRTRGRPIARCATSRTDVVRRRADFDSACERLAVPLVLRHRDEIDQTIQAAADGRYPCVVGVSAAGARMVMDRDDLEACAGDPAVLVDRLNAAM